jgi:hypothetical protein
MHALQLQRPVRFVCLALLLASIVVSPALLPAAAAGAEYYQWTDEEGVLHLSNMPPEEPLKKPRRVTTTRMREPAPAADAAPREDVTAVQTAPGAAPVSGVPATTTPAPEAAAPPEPRTSPVPQASGFSGTSSPTPGGAAVAPGAQQGAGTSAEPFRNLPSPDEMPRESGGTVQGTGNPRLQ